MDEMDPSIHPAMYDMAVGLIKEFDLLEEKEQGYWILKFHFKLSLDALWIKCLIICFWFFFVFFVKKQCLHPQYYMTFSIL